MTEEAKIDLKLPPRKRPKKVVRRLSPAQWAEAEELYRQGWTQAQISDRFKVRIETVSRHMTSKKVKGGERAEAVREEIASALMRKQREFTEIRAQREIDAKEMLFKMNNVLLSAYAKEFQAALTGGRGLVALSGSAKALKDSLMSLRLGREEIWAILEVKEGGADGDLPQLQVSSMSEEEENTLRSRVEPDEDDEDLAEQVQDVIENIEHQIAMGAKGAS